MNDTLLKHVNALEMELNRKFNDTYPNNSNQLPPNYNGSNSNQQSSQPVIINNYNSSSYPYPLFGYGYGMPYSQPVIINNGTTYYSDAKSSKKEDKDTSDPVTGLIGGAILALACTYTMSGDEYIKYKMSAVSNKLRKLKNYYTYSNDDNIVKDQINSIIMAYEKWEALYTSRTLKKCGAKTAVFGSGLSVCAGLFGGNSGLQAYGFIGATVSGCYLLWQYLTEDIHDEQTLYNDIFTKMNKLYYTVHQNYETYLNNNKFEPSAPPSYDNK
jgi:hypothetical protein